MKKFKLLFLLLIGGINLFAQINFENQSVNVRAVWKQGEKKKYKTTYSKMRVEREDTVVFKQVSFDLSVEVLEKTKDGYVIQWNYQNLGLDGFDKTIPKKYYLGDGIKIMYKIDKNGAFVDVVNFDEFLTTYSKALTSIENIMGQYKRRGEVIDLVESVFERKYPKPTATLDDIIYYHQFYGYEYGLEKFTGDSTKIPNKISNVPEMLDGEYYFTLDEITKDTKEFVLFFEQYTDEEQLRENYYRNIKKYKQVVDKKEKTDEDLEFLDSIFESMSNTVYMRENGWIVNMFFGKYIGYGDHIEIEERKLELIER